jgi:maltose alpha-D-glucosyltransferase/alpha-amylase
VLCVFSFAHNPIAVEITDPAFAGATTYDLFGGGQFPSFSEDGKLTMTLGTQSFYWLHIGEAHFAGGRV